MTISLKDISQIRFGHYTPTPVTNGIPYMQANQFDEFGNMVSKPNIFIDVVDEKAKAHLLKEGDILFVGKGNKMFAWCYHNSFGQAIASTIFFVITPDRNKILPEYLTAILNQGKNIQYFKQLGAGSSIASIRKNELGDFKLNLLPLAQQKRIVALYEIHQNDINLTLQLLQNKNDLYEAIINKLTK